MKRLSCPMLLPHRGALPLGTYCERNLINAASASASLVVDADRKSTRLNSSHLVISYAVFCLKKKKVRHTYNEDFHILARGSEMVANGAIALLGFATHPIGTLARLDTLCSVRRRWVQRRRRVH